MMNGVHGNISHAMRDNYNEFGVDEYYRKVAATYRNPFFPSIKQVVWSIFNRWYDQEWSQVQPARPIRLLDMAAGSGEVTSCLLEWEEIGRSGQSANNVPAGKAFIPPKARARSGLPPSLPPEFKLDIVATDPFTSPAYTERTQRPCHPLSFADLAKGELPPDSASDTPIWDIVLCSFALHLVPSSSELWALLYELSSKATWFIIIAPHKKPEIKDGWGWIRWDIDKWEENQSGGDHAPGLELVREKTRLRVYRSANA